MFHGEIRQDIIESIVKRVPLEKLMFELPVVVVEVQRLL